MTAFVKLGREAAPRERERSSCPAVAGKGDRAFARWKGRGTRRGQTIQGETGGDAFIALKRQRCGESDAPPTALRAVPPPRYRGAGEDCVPREQKRLFTSPRVREEVEERSDEGEGASPRF